MAEIDETIRTYLAAIEVEGKTLNRPGFDGDSVH